ncbi:MAG: cytochrome c biogenesis protein CcsA [Muribaculaceae bacterium]|nr:cytochrome c biogenesis protein CcsA [Muribaculaceae bacterium]
MRRIESKTIIFIAAVVLSLLIGLSSLCNPGIYSSVVWHILWILIAAGLILGMIKGRLWRNVPAFIMHLSFLCMIAGGFCTSTFSKRGTLHLLPQQTATSFTTTDGRYASLPSSVTLLSFTQDYYPGMNFPKDFRTVLKTESGDTLCISMNHIGRLGNYRLYQTSYDEMGGTVLTVTHDPAGIAVTYAGFMLFAISGILMLLTRFRKSRTANGCRMGCIVLFLMLFCYGTASAVPAVNPELADSLASRQVLFNGRTVSFAGFADRLTYKLTGRGNVAGLSPEAFVASLIKYQEEWSRVRFIKVKNKILRDSLGIEGEYASIADFYDENGIYLPGLIYRGGEGALDKNILALDEKIALLIELWEGHLFTPLPHDSEYRRSDFSIKAEILYYRINPVRILFICVLIIVALILLSEITGKNLRIFTAISATGAAGIIAYLWLWYISGSIPLSNTSDLMEFAGICIILLSGVASWRKESSLLVALGMAAASFLLLVALLGMKDPVLSPVMPVLASPWLSIHVSIVMLSYAILGFTLPVAITALAVSSQRRRLIRLALSLLAPGVFLLGLGIITGAMWANVSWGRYWAWDPKETWSLVTLLIYSIPLHKYFKMRTLPKFCCTYLILAFSAIIMTYFGVNLLPSLHAYN